MIKLFVSDLDGTLLNENHVLSEENKNAVLEMRKQGISFMPASGRCYDDLQHAIADLKIHPKCICLNGAEFYDNDGTLLISNPIEEKLVNQIYEVVASSECEADYYLEDGRYTNAKQEDLRELLLNRIRYQYSEEESTQAIDLFFKEMRLEERVKCEEDIQKILSKKILKIELVFKEAVERNRVHKKLEEIEGIIITSSHISNLEINSIEANKGHMIEQVCLNYGYHKDEVVVIGDGMNDITMLSRFNHSYAMGQASQRVKEAAKNIASSNVDHGVAEVIYSMIERNKKMKDNK